MGTAAHLGGGVSLEEVLTELVVFCCVYSAQVMSKRAGHAGSCAGHFRDCLRAAEKRKRRPGRQPQPHKERSASQHSLLDVLKPLQGCSYADLLYAGGPQAWAGKATKAGRDH